MCSTLESLRQMNAVGSQFECPYIEHCGEDLVGKNCKLIDKSKSLTKQKKETELSLEIEKRAYRPRD